MKKILLGALFVLSVATIYSIYFVAVNNLLNLPSEPEYLTHNKLSKNSVYFRIANTDSTNIEVFKYVGSLDSGKKQVICYQYPLDLKENGTNFEEAVNWICKTQAKFLFDYSHPVNNDTLHVVTSDTISSWLSHGKIMYQWDSDYRDDFFANTSFLSKAISFFYLYPLGHLFWIVLLIFFARGCVFLLNLFTNQRTKAIVTITALTAIFIFMGYSVANEFSLLVASLQLVIVAVVYYLHQIWQKKNYGFWTREILKFYTIILVPVIIGLGLGLLQLFGKSEDAFMDYLSINLLGVGLIIYSLLAGIPLALANFINNLIDYNQQKKVALLRLELEKKNNDYKAAEIDSLMARMNPHFLFNGLNAITALVHTDPNKAEGMAMGLAQFYKYASNRENKIFTTLKEEIDLLHHYLAVENLRFGNALHTQIEMHEGLDQVLIPYMMLQPLAENAIKYGFNAANQTVSLTITLHAHKDQLHIGVYDEGKPFDETIQHGFGLHSLNRKLELLYDGAFVLQFVNSPKKHVFLQLPLKTAP